MPIDAAHALVRVISSTEPPLKPATFGLTGERAVDGAKASNAARPATATPTCPETFVDYVDSPHE